MDKFPEAFKRFESSDSYPSKKNPTLNDFMQGFREFQHRGLSYLQERALKEQVRPELIQKRTFVMLYYKRKRGTQTVFRDKKTGRWIKRP
jgi:hypothetical protein